MDRKLKFTEFDVNMVYGFVAEYIIAGKLKETEFEEYIKKRCGYDDSKPNGILHIRDGWNSTYQINSGPSKVYQFETEPILDIEITLLEGHKSHWPNAKTVLKGTLNTLITIRLDGTGTCTLNFSFPETSTEYLVSDILLVSGLVPRTLHKKDPAAKIKLKLPSSYDKINAAAWSNFLKLPPPDDRINAEAWDGFSVPFKIFITTMNKLFTETRALHWGEFGFDSRKMDKALYGDLNCANDPQVPYQYVFAAIPGDLYRQSFLEGNGDSEDAIKNKKEKQKEFTKEISALLGRWLNENNIKYASNDYWESQGLMKNDRFLNKYMNSIVFTTYSGHLCLSFYPSLIDEKDEAGKKLMENVITTSRETILRCLEFSRMRLHFAIWLSRSMDSLVVSIINTPNTSDFLPLLSKLIGLEGKAALLLEDPNSYLWDASVGSHLATFLHQNVIENVENEIAKKIDQSRNLLDDKVKYIQVKDYIELYPTDKK